MAPNTTIRLFLHNTRFGDVVTVLRGCQIPLVLKKVEGGRFEVVGEIFVSGSWRETLERHKEVEIELV